MACGHLDGGDQHHDRPRRLEARIVEHADQRNAEEHHHQQEPDDAAGETEPHQPELAEVLGRGRRRPVPVERDQHPADNRAAEQQRKARQEIADVVDAEQVEREVLAEDDAVALGDHEAADGAEKDPLAEVHQLVAGLAPPNGSGSAVRATARSRATSLAAVPTMPPMTSAQIERVEAASATIATMPMTWLTRSSWITRPRIRWRLRRLDSRRAEPADQQGESGDGQELREHRLAVEPRQGPGQRAGAKPEQEAPDHLQRPGGVEEVRVVAAPILRDRRGRPEVGEVPERHHRHGDERHHAKGFREEQPGQDQVRGQPDRLRGTEPEDRPGGAAHGAGDEPLVAQKGRDHRHREGPERGSARAAIPAGFWRGLDIASRSHW